MQGIADTLGSLYEHVNRMAIECPVQALMFYKCRLEIVVVILLCGFQVCLKIVSWDGAILREELNMLWKAKITNASYQVWNFPSLEFFGVFYDFMILL